VRCWAPDERTRLCDLLDERGPDAPTRCAGWRTGDLAAHLVVREHSLLAAAGIFVPVLAPVTVRAMARVRQRPFATLVDRIRRGGLLPREGRLGDALHLLEFVVHRQDVVRASTEADQDGGVDDGLDAAVFDQLRRCAGRLGRAVPPGVGLLVRSYRHGAIEVRRGPAVLVVDGAPVELALWLYGRGPAARVRVERHGASTGTVARVEASLHR
jgi:uncharacterized protein (TIGR03085 family)